MSRLTNLTRALLLAGVAAVAFQAPAHASLLCVTGVCTEALDTGALGTDLNTNLGFDLFDTTLGTLISVSVGITAQMDILGTSNLTNNTGSAQTFHQSEQSFFSLADTTHPLSGLATALAAVALSPTYSQLYTSLANGSTVAFGPTSPSLSTTLTSPLSAFEQSGGGTDTVNVTTLTGTTTLGGGGNMQTNIFTQGELTINITYDYTTSAPEPASIALLGAGLAGLGVIRRRRKA